MRAWPAGAPWVRPQGQADKGKGSGAHATCRSATPPTAHSGLFVMAAHPLKTPHPSQKHGSANRRAMEMLQDKGPDLGDVGQRLGMLEHLTQAGKQVGKEFSRMDKEVAKAKKAKTAAQYPEVIAKIEGDVNALKQRWASVKDEALSGNAEPEDIREAMEEIFEGVGGVHQSLGLLCQLGSISKMIKTAEKEITRFDKEIARQKKAGKDTEALETLLSEARAKLGEIKTFAGQRGFDPEDLFDLMHDLEKIRNDALAELDKIAGTTGRTSQIASVIQSLSWRRLGF